MTSLRITKYVQLLVAILILVGISACSLSESELLDRARTKWGAGDAQAAVIDLKNALSKNPNNSEARLLLGKIYARIGQGEDAEKELELAIKNGADKNQAYPYLGEALLIQGKNEVLLGTITVDPSLPNEINSIYNSLIGNAYLQQKNIDQAQKSYLAAKELSPKNVDSITGLARISIVKNNPNDAKTSLLSVLTSLPDQNIWTADVARASLLLGDILLSTNEPKEAEKAYQAVIKHEPKAETNFNFLATINLAKAQMAQDNLNGARDTLSPLLKNHPDHPIPNRMMALVEYQSKNYELAETHSMNVLKVIPQDPISNLLLGTIEAQQSKFELANAHLEKFISVAPDYVPARKLLAKIKIGLQLPKEALELLQSTPHSEEEDTELLTLVSKAALQLGNPDMAVSSLKKAIQAEPDQASLRADLASVYIAEGKFDLAINELKNTSVANSIAPKNDLLLAIAYAQKKELPKALSLANNILDKQPDYAPAHIFVARLAEASRDNKNAMMHYSKALDVQPSNAAIALRLARLEQKEGMLDSAYSRLTKLLQDSPKFLLAKVELANLEESRGNFSAALDHAKQLQKNSETEALGYELEGNLYLKRKEFDNALSSYEKLASHIDSEALTLKRASIMSNVSIPKTEEFLEQWLTKHPTHAATRTTLAGFQLQQGKLDIAIRNYEAVLEKHPNNIPALNNLAWIYFEKKDKRAKGLAKKALDLAPKSPAIMDTYGWILVNTGNVKEGLPMLQSAFDAAPNNKDIAKHLAEAKNMR